MSHNMSKPNFEAIYHEDGTCMYWDCRKPGAVLAYDETSPEVANWFCSEHWIEHESNLMLTIAEDKRQITHAYRWSNDMVMAFDQWGHQMSDYQGRYSDVVDKINAVYSGTWYSGAWNKGTVGIMSHGVDDEMS